MSLPFAPQVHDYYVVAQDGAGKIKRRSRIVQELHMTRDEAREFRQNASTLAHPDHYLVTATAVRRNHTQALADWNTRGA